jgi:hypothetical protein
MDKHRLVRRLGVVDALGESADSRSQELTEPFPIVGRIPLHSTNVIPRRFIAVAGSAYFLAAKTTPTITYDFLNRKYGELDSRQADENKQRNLF